MGRSNPNSRSSELTDPMRRSFSGNPFPKPSLIPNARTFSSANTPSDFQRRNSVGGREVAGSFFHDLDDKENGKDQILKPSKVRSPAATSKNAKNFMSPTISASSKVTVSPRKNVLVERNEPARTSVPSTTTKAKNPTIRKVTFAEPLPCSDFKSENDVEQKNFVALSFDGVPNEEIHATSLSSEDLSGEAPVFDMSVPFYSKNETESSFDTVADEPDCVILDPSFKLSPTPTPTPPVSSASSILAPLDADPLMPPYDPKTNYLSPRPQFLHYRPKPRTELFNERELGDNLMYGSFSDTEVTEDTQSEGSQKSEDVSSDEVIEEEAGISEPSPALAEETVEAREVPKPYFFMRSKAIIALLLLFSIAFISVSVTNSSVMDHPVFQDFYKVYESSDFSEFAKANFDQFSEFAKAKFDWSARNFHTWFTKSLSSISELISNVRGVPNFGHLQYYNLTVLHEYNAVYQEPIFGPGERVIVKTPEVYPLVLNNEESDTALEIGTDEDGDFGDISEEDYEPVYGEQVQQDTGETTAVENAPEPDEVLEGQLATVIESDQPFQLAEVSEPHPSEVVIDLNHQPSLDAKAADIHSEVLKNGDLEVKTAKQECDAEVNVDKYSGVGLKDQPDVTEIHTETYGDNDIELNEAEGESTSIDAAVEDNEPRSETIYFLPHMVLYLLPIGGTILIAGAAFKWLRKGKSRSTRVTSCVEQPVFAKAAFHAKEEPSLRNGPSEIDMLGESLWPSEMSSIQKSSSNRQKVMKELNEVHSLEKKPKKRRESLASSSDYSMSSPSYGSFTTYEKIQIKNGYDEETITPVRRSSRIRSQATSPL